MFLLCTDGLTAALEDEEILGQILLDNPGPDTLSRLIDQANARGGPDNITLALAVLLDGDGPSEE
jgi:protein phosphatase